MRRFPIGLTVASAIAFLLLCALGVWQVERWRFKLAEQAHIDALQHAPAAPLGTLLSALPRGGAIEYRRVEVRCGTSHEPPPTLFRFAERNEQIAWRLMTICNLDPAANGGFDGIVLDRGVVDRFVGETAPAAVSASPPARVQGVLRQPGSKAWLGGAGIIPVNGVDTVRLLDRAGLLAFARRSGLSRPAPLYLATEIETPSPSGLTAVPLPATIINNCLYYAITWFSLAAILLVFYVAMLRKRGGMA